MHFPVHTLSKMEETRGWIRGAIRSSGHVCIRHGWFYHLRVSFFLCLLPSSSVSALHAYSDSLSSVRQILLLILPRYLQRVPSQNFRCLEKRSSLSRCLQVSQLNLPSFYWCDGKSRCFQSVSVAKGKSLKSPARLLIASAWQQWNQLRGPMYPGRP